MKSRWSFRTAVLFTALSAVPGWADDTTTEAAIGGGIGGAVGAVVGSELGGRDGAIVGAGIGGAAGAAIATHDDDHEDVRTMREPPDGVHVVWVQPQRSVFCPPGQAKKGRC